MLAVILLLHCKNRLPRNKSEIFWNVEKRVYEQKSASGVKMVTKTSFPKQRLVFFSYEQKIISLKQFLG